jgi:hypothetical protein
MWRAAALEYDRTVPHRVKGGCPGRRWTRGRGFRFRAATVKTGDEVGGGAGGGTDSGGSTEVRVGDFGGLIASGCRECQGGSGGPTTVRCSGGGVASAVGGQCRRAEAVREEESWRKNNRGRRIPRGGSIREPGSHTPHIARRVA